MAAVGEKIDPSELDDSGAVPTVQIGQKIDPADLDTVAQPGSAVAPPGGPSTLESLGRGAAQGATLGLGERIQGAIQASLPMAGDPADWRDRYAQQLKEAQDENDRARKAHPIAYGAGNVGGAIVATPLLPVTEPAAGAGLAARMAAGAASGAPVAGAIGLAESRDPTLAGKLEDAAKNSGLGLLVGGTVPAVTTGASRFFDWLGEKLGKSAIDMGRKAITGVSSTLARRKPLDPDVVENAFQVGAIKPFSDVEGIANRLSDVADEQGQQYRDILQALEDKGVHGPDAENLAQYLRGKAWLARQNSIVGTRADALDNAAEELAGKTLPSSGQGRLGLMQSEFQKRELQQAAANDFVREGPQSLAGGARKELAGDWRQAIEDAVQQQSNLAPQEAADFQPVKEGLHKTLSALGPASEAAARKARRSPFGLQEAMGVATGLASGSPAKALEGAGIMNALKNRGASTIAVGERALGQGLKGAAGADLTRAPVTAAAALPDLQNQEDDRRDQAQSFAEGGEAEPRDELHGWLGHKVSGFAPGQTANPAADFISQQVNPNYQRRVYGKGR
jgi:hypothetical protein